jgi:hypothetical protein
MLLKVCSKKCLHRVTLTHTSNATCNDTLNIFKRWRKLAHEASREQCRCKHRHGTESKGREGESWGWRSWRTAGWVEKGKTPSLLASHCLITKSKKNRLAVSPILILFYNQLKYVYFIFYIYVPIILYIMYAGVFPVLLYHYI